MHGKSEMQIFETLGQTQVRGKSEMQIFQILIVDLSVPIPLKPIHYKYAGQTKSHLDSPIFLLTNVASFCNN